MLVFFRCWTWTDIYKFAYDDNDASFQVSCRAVTARNIMYYPYYVSLDALRPSLMAH